MDSLYTGLFQDLEHGECVVYLTGLNHTDKVQLVR